MLQSNDLGDLVLDAEHLPTGISGEVAELVAGPVDHGGPGPSWCHDLALAEVVPGVAQVVLEVVLIVEDSVEQSLKRYQVLTQLESSVNLLVND